MFPLWTILGWLVQMIPGVLLDPSRAIIFWLVVLLVSWQYRRSAAAERLVYGEMRVGVWKRTLLSAAQGLLAGLLGSLLIIVLGVTISGAGLGYLLPLALLLMTINPRFICFSYAGGLVSLAWLLTGWPPINVPGVMGLVAALHATESLLILFGGSRWATALTVRTPRGTVAGFSLQQFWPVPIVVLWLTTGVVGDGVGMPDWWPLILPAAEMAVNDSNLMYVLLPVVAVLGYGDIAISSHPRHKAVFTAGWLMLYSICLMGLAIAASRVPPLAWVAALFGPLGHEVVIGLGNRREFRRPPRLRPPATGVRILDVTPGSLCDRLGMRSGDVITQVNGEPVRNRQDLGRLLEESVFGAEFAVSRDGAAVVVLARRRPADGRWGLVLVPEQWEPALMELGSGGMLTRWVRRLAAGWRRDDAR